MLNNDLISRAALKKELAPQNDWSWGNGAYVRDMIDAMPTVDAEPVRHGYIEIKVINPYDGEDCYCSECGHWSLLPDYKWCPYCGAKMDGRRG